MTIRTCYRTLILALLFSAIPLATVQAGLFTELSKRWFAKIYLAKYASLRWFAKIYLAKNASLYPFNMWYQHLNCREVIEKDLITPIDNTKVQKTYPCACAYVQKELEKVGINPATIRLINVDKLSDSRTTFNTLSLALNTLEPALGGKQEPDDFSVQGNRTKAIIAHEIGHLEMPCMLWAARMPIVSSALTLALTYRYCSPTSVYGGLLNTVCSQALLHIWAHYDEYHADTHMIKRFKKEPQVLVDAASYWLETHKQDAVVVEKSFVAAASENYAKKLVPVLCYNPMKNAALHWMVDTHGSHLLRANRLLKAAGVPSTPSILARELLRQHNEAPGTCDFKRIMAAIQDWQSSKDAVELPDVFKTYWT